MTLNAIYQQAAEGGYTGFVAELPGAITQGETLQETRENLKDDPCLSWKAIAFLLKKRCGAGK